MTQETFIISQSPAVTIEDTKTIIKKRLQWHLDYLSNIRNVLVIDPVPPGSQPIYDIDDNMRDFKIFADGVSDPIDPIDEHKASVPTFDHEFKSKLPGKLSEFKAMSFYRDLQKQIIDKENSILVNLLDKATECSEQVVIADEFNLKRMIVEAKKRVDIHDVVTAKILINKDWFLENRHNLGDAFAPAYHDHDSNTFGYIYGTDMMQADIPRGTLYVMADCEFIGVMPIIKDIEINIVDDDNVTLSYNAGYAVFCPQHICKIYTRICSI